MRIISLLALSITLPVQAIKQIRIILKFWIKVCKPKSKCLEILNKRVGGQLLLYYLFLTVPLRHKQFIKINRC